MASMALLSASPLYQHNAKLCLARIHRRIGNSSDGSQVRSAYSSIVNLIYKISFKLFPRCEMLSVEQEQVIRAYITELQSFLDAFLDALDTAVDKVDLILEEVEALGKKSKSQSKPSAPEWKRALKGIARPSGKESRLFLDIFNLYWAGIYEPYIQACEEEPKDNIRHLDDVLPSLMISLQQMRKNAQSIDSMAYEILRIHTRSTTAEERAYMLNEVDLEPRKLNDDQISPLDLNFRSPTLSNDLEADDTIEEPLCIKVTKRPTLPRLNTNQPLEPVHSRIKQRPVPIMGPSPASSFPSQTNDCFPTSGDLSDIESIRQRLAAVLRHGSQSSIGSVSERDASIDGEDGDYIDDDDDDAADDGKG